MSQLSIFLSYTSADKTFADRLVSSLRAASADVWHDAHKIVTNDDYHDHIMERMHRSILIVVLSDAALADDMVRTDCKFADAPILAGQPWLVLTVVAAPYDPSQWHVSPSVQYPLPIEGDDHQPLSPDEAISRVVRLLHLTPPGQAVVPAVPQSDDTLHDLIRSGDLLVIHGRYKEAATFRRRVTQLDPGNPQAWLALGSVRYRLGQYAASKDALDNALTLDANLVDAWRIKSDVLNALAHHEEALEAFGRYSALIRITSTTSTPTVDRE